MNKFIKIRISSAGAGQNLAAYLARSGYFVHADCGGKGKCGKCRVKLCSGVLFDNPECTHVSQPDAHGWYLACRVYGGHGATVLLPEQEGDGLTDFAGQNLQGASSSADLGIALDIGTTTLAMALVDIESGSVLATTSALNPQKSYGADVISRIDAVMQHPEALLQMQQLLLDTVRDMMRELLRTKTAHRMVVAGNPTMLHVFCGISPVSMGSYPFTPVFTDAKTLPGRELNLPVQSVTLLPSISAFVGGDVTAGMLHTRLCAQEQPCILLDVGTNGEIVLFTGTAFGSRLYATSAAAGPAMEGAGISTGMGGVRGAVCAFRMQNGKPLYSTVGDAPAKGICGSGLIDLVAALYQANELDETGAFERGEQYVYATDEKGAPLSLLQSDVRALQLAKSAIRACIDAICAHANLLPHQISRVFLAGGLGYYMNVDSAAAIGLFPAEIKQAVHSVGNAALGGCVQVLANPDLIGALQSTLSQCQTLELSTNAVWNQSFMENMMFPCKEDET
ncbi:MAG: DUF4445 domain-containing protein [Ruminococcaceae bacterium]|nr:DUF4445 domain-containing protein [Oscillospiraceae bacterium]